MAQQTTILANWKRLTNITTVFNIESAQASVWKGYVVVVLVGASRTLHFYHLTHELWSTVSAVDPSSGWCLRMCAGCTLTTHDAKLMLLSNSGDVYKFSGNKWIIHPELRVKEPKISSSDPHVIFSSNSLGEEGVHSLILLESLDGQSLHTFRYFQTSQNQWSQQRKLQESVHVFCPPPSGYHQGRYQGSYAECLNDCYHTSYASLQGSMYVSNGQQVHCIDLRYPEAEIIPVVKIAQIPLLQYTISSVDGTLFSFGGRDEENQPSSDIYHYNSCSETWEPAGYMRNARYGALVIPVTENGDTTQVIVVGGCLGRNKERLCSRAVESCEVRKN